MDNCIAKAHSIDYVDEVYGVTTWHCKTCDIDYPQYQDFCSGR